APVTDRLVLAPLVLCQSYRSPALVAKMAASLYEIAAGRLVLGLGAGWVQEEDAAYGYPFPLPPVRLGQLAGALEVMNRLWRERRATFAGTYHALRDAPCLPKPEHLPILLGGASDRLLELTASYADLWNCPNLSWRRFEPARDRLLRCCEAQ